MSNHPFITRKRRITAAIQLNLSHVDQKLITWWVPTRILWPRILELLITHLIAAVVLMNKTVTPNEEATIFLDWYLGFKQFIPHET